MHVFCNIHSVFCSVLVSVSWPNPVEHGPMANTITIILTIITIIITIILIIITRWASTMCTAPWRTLSPGSVATTVRSTTLRWDLPLTTRLYLLSCQQDFIFYPANKTLTFILPPKLKSYLLSWYQDITFYLDNKALSCISPPILCLLSCHHSWNLTVYLATNVLSFTPQRLRLYLLRLKVVVEDGQAIFVGGTWVFKQKEYPAKMRKKPLLVFFYL